MPLPSNPSRDAIWVELDGSVYKSSGANNNHLQDMYAYVFDDTSGQYSRDSFAGYGQPTLNTDGLQTSNVGTNSVDLTISVSNYANLTANFEARYSTDTVSTNPPWTYESLGTASSGNPTFPLTGLSDDTSYVIEVGVYNKFNDASRSGYVFTERHEIRTDTAQFTQPGINSCSKGSGTFGSYIQAEWNYGSSPSSFDAQTRVNNGSWNNVTLDSSSNWGTSSNPKTGTWNVNPMPSFGDNVEVRIRASAEGGQSASSWSAPCGFTW